MVGTAALTWTELAAWGGFVLAAGKLGWDFYVWHRKQARVHIRIKRKVFFPDELPDNQQDTPHYVTFLIVNIGELPTTVDRIYISNRPGRLVNAFTKRKRNGEIGYGYPALAPYDGEAIPRLLSSGATARLRIKQELLDANPHLGTLYLHVETAESQYSKSKSIPEK